MIGAVVIARNEGERLKTCLRSIIKSVPACVYVDSGSTDGSPEFAESLGIQVLRLDMSIPFSMARARNEGFDVLDTQFDDLEYVQFIDGDCEMRDGWLGPAADFLGSHERVAAVCGRRRERYPDASIFNRLADMEWDRPAGKAEACGGDALVRATAFREVKGYRIELIAGEEPEMCFRLRGAGWDIWRLDEEMTWHDAHILLFSAWMRRHVRGGYGALDVFQRLKGQMPDDQIPFCSMVRSARRWTLQWLGVTVVATILTTNLAKGHLWAGVTCLVFLALWWAQAARLAVKEHQSGSSWDISLKYGALTMISKWAQMWGQMRFFWDRFRGRKAVLIEYKGRDTAANQKKMSAWQADKACYPKHAFVREQSLWALAVYRFGRWNDARRRTWSQRIYDRLYWFLFRVVETLTGVSFTKQADIGPGLRIYHFGNIFIHSNVVMGSNCTIRQGVTIGNRVEDGGVPVLGDGVEVGAYAQILGDISVGDHAKIGAMSVVLQDVPAYGTAVGIPARIIAAKKNAGTTADAN